jgi:amino acid transporter
MSGDLKHPSKAIPKGTLYGLGLTFVLYTVAIFALAASISRETFYRTTNVIQLVSVLLRSFYILLKVLHNTSASSNVVCLLMPCFFHPYAKKKATLADTM